MNESQAPGSPPPGWAEAANAVNKAFADRGIEMLPCGVCGQRDTFTLSDGYFVASTSDRGDRYALGGRGWPLISLLCRNCGHTVFLNAVKLGLGVNLFQREIS